MYKQVFVEVICLLKVKFQIIYLKISITTATYLSNSKREFFNRPKCPGKLSNQFGTGFAILTLKCMTPPFLWDFLYSNLSDEFKNFLFAFIKTGSLVVRLFMKIHQISMTNFLIVTYQSDLKKIMFV